MGRVGGAWLEGRGLGLGRGLAWPGLKGVAGSGGGAWPEGRGRGGAGSGLKGVAGWGGAGRAESPRENWVTPSMLPRLGKGPSCWCGRGAIGGVPRPQDGKDLALHDGRHGAASRAHRGSKGETAGFTLTGARGSV